MTKRPPSHAVRSKSTPRTAQRHAHADPGERKSKCNTKSKPSLPLCRDMLLQARSLIVFLHPECSQARRAAHRLKPTVCEAKMSNSCGSGRKRLPLLRHQSGFQLRRQSPNTLKFRACRCEKRRNDGKRKKPRNQFHHLIPRTTLFPPHPPVRYHFIPQRESSGLAAILKTNSFTASLACVQLSVCQTVLAHCCH